MEPRDSPLPPPAGQLGVQHLRLQQLRIQLRTRAEDLAWHSPAAKAFGEVLQGLLSQLRRAESLTGELFEATQRHLRTVQRRERDVAAAAGVVSTTARELGKLL